MTLDPSIYDSKVDDLDESLIAYRFELEAKVMSLISNGNIEGLETFMKEVRFRQAKPSKMEAKVYRIPSNPLRDRKNGLVIRNTFSRIAAKNGGLPPLYVHLISEKYALMIEQADSLEYLENVISESLFREYAEAVNRFSTLRYSKLIKDVVAYITENLTNELTLAILSESFHVHPSHLSRKFKQETGLTITDYIQHHRINYAQLLLQEGNPNILEVANQSGFNSSSYFDRVFKKIKGQTPSEYLKGTRG